MLDELSSTWLTNRHPPHVSRPGPSSQLFPAATSSPRALLTPQQPQKPLPLRQTTLNTHKSPTHNRNIHNNRPICPSSSAANPNCPRSRRSLRPKLKSIWFLICTAGTLHPLLAHCTLLILQYHYLAPLTHVNKQASQILFRKMHRHIVPRSGPEQGRIRMSGSVRGQVLRGQCQGQREDAGRGERRAGRGRYVWWRDVRWVTRIADGRGKKLGG